MSDMFPEPPDINKFVQVIPLNDDIDHIESHLCACDPYVDLDDGLVIHHAKDMREKYERGGHINPDKQWIVIKPEEGEG